MIKLAITLVTITIAIESLLFWQNGVLVDGANIGRLDLGQPWNCADVIQNPTEIRRELVSRNLNGDHKIIKFIENCIKSVDGWRFKKSGGLQKVPIEATSSGSGRSGVQRAFALQPNLLKRLVFGSNSPSSLYPSIIDSNNDNNNNMHNYNIYDNIKDSGSLYGYAFNLNQTPNLVLAQSSKQNLLHHHHQQQQQPQSPTLSSSSISPSSTTYQSSPPSSSMNSDFYYTS